MHLEIQSIYADLATLAVEETIPAGSSPSNGVRPPSEYDKCQGPVQKQLQYGVSGRTKPDGVPVPVDESESLAEAVCCDSRMQSFAEPQFLYESPDISLFTKIREGDVTTFYDSVCGLPLFKAPVNRSFAEFQADTQEHGWPSFRTEEVISKNIMTDKSTGYVTSKCGTHLGSYLPDENGPRWCIDLTCVAGNPTVPVMGTKHV